MSCSVSSLVIFLTLSMVFHRQEKLVGNGTDENKGHIRPLTRMVRHRSLHVPIKINVSVSGSVAVSMSVHMESRTICFNCLDFYGIRGNGIAL